MRRGLLLALLLALAASAATAQTSSISKLRNSKHDLSSASSTPIKAQSENETCLYCHTPHNAQPAVPLWNHSLSQGITYQVYQSTTIKSAVPQPQAQDSTKLCLSCHDGTIALGDTVNSGQIPFQNIPTDQKLPSSSVSNLAGGTLSLADDHPVGFVPDTAHQPQIMMPVQSDAVRLDAQGRVQCTSCHDPHNETQDTTEKRFLVKSNSASAICLSCHDLKGGAGADLWSWSGAQGIQSSHKTAANAYTAQSNASVGWLGAHTGYTTTAANACAACHRSHTAHDSARLLKGQTDQVCFQCHDGNPQTALRDVQSEFSRKMYVHPSLGAQAGHDPSEAPDSIVSRHAACDDCHNPHAARARTSTIQPPQLSTSLYGASGIASGGTPLDPHRGTGEAGNEYEVCFKCHSYNPNQPQGGGGFQTYGPQPVRQLLSIDLRLALTSSAAWHPVTRARGLSSGPGGEVPSLLSAPVDRNGAPISGRTLSASSQIYCTDCHNNDSGRNLGGSATSPGGPHGSNVNHILERSYVIQGGSGQAGSFPDLPYSTSNYALCYKCHSESSLRNDESFKEHWEHMQITSCSTCHDPHGVPFGNSTNNSRLINFDTRIVAPVNGRLEFRDTGYRQGTCTLRCHSEDHNSKGY